MRRAIRDAIRRRALRHAMALSSPTMVRVPGGAGARWCGCPVVRVPGGLMMFSYARLCPVMPDDVWLLTNVRICPDCPEYARIMPGLCPDDVRLFPMMSGCLVCPATALRDASGPTIALSRAAERTTIKRHGHTKE